MCGTGVKEFEIEVPPSFCLVFAAVVLPPSVCLRHARTHTPAQLHTFVVCVYVGVDDGGKGGRDILKERP